MSDTQPATGSSVLGDDELLRKAKNAANGRKFESLFDEGWESRAVQRAYGEPDHARLALINQLLWWARHDVAQVWRLFERSALWSSDLERYREYFADLVRAARSLLGDACYDPNYGATSEADE